MPGYVVTFQPDAKSAAVSEGKTLLDAATEAGVALRSACGGNGTCGQCRVMVRSGKVHAPRAPQLRPDEAACGMVLACQATVHSDVEVEVPPRSRLVEHQVVTGAGEASAVEAEKGGLRPVFRKVCLSLPEPCLEDSASDLTRLYTALAKDAGSRNFQVDLGVLRKAPRVVRDGNWQVTVSCVDARGMTEVVDIVPGRDDSPCYGLAVDVGTTTCVTHLVDLASGDTLDVRGAYNRQSRFGDDVISRIIYADENEDGLARLQEAVIETINDLIGEAARHLHIKDKDIKVVVCAGNTTMTHLLLGIPPTYIRLEPYTPAATSVPPVKALEIGLHVAPEAWLFCLPGVASYVGGDITSGVVATGVANSDDVVLFVDIGTNGEMVLGNRDWLLACACSAGPAFEGVGIRHGMRAMRGAIEHVEVDPAYDEVAYRTIGAAKPAGICGSGLIDCLASLRRAGVISRNGSFDVAYEGKRMRTGDDGPQFVLAYADETATGEDIYISEADLKNLIRSKAAVYAGIRSMLRMVDQDISDIKKILIAGGFGSYLNIRKAIEIGLLPDLPESVYQYVGNTSVAGAKMCLLYREARREVELVARRMTYLELSVGNTFMEEFVSALFLPHTDLALFPSVLA
ncbi:MAG: ASKHA domain-containing protein [Bacillota bacterium]